MLDVQPKLAIDEFLSRMRIVETLCVAVSGGSDSTALLHLLHERLKGKKKPRLVAVTVDHGLRPASAQEAGQVAAFCRSRKIEHRIMKWSGDKPESGVQDAARNARYELLREAALDVGTNAVVTAHTRDDQIETIRMRQRRGMGRGLSGMAEAVLFRRDCWILRPLLKVRRTALQETLKQSAINWTDDPSNRDRRFERVRIRFEDSDPSADGELLSMVEAMAEARRRDGERLARFLHDNVTIHGDMIAELQQVPEGLSDVLQQAVALLAALMGGRAYLPGSRSQDQIARLVAGGGPPRVNLSRSVLDRRTGRVFVYRERRSVPTISIAAGSEAIWDGRYRFINHYKRRDLIIGPTEDNSQIAPPDLPNHLPRGVVARAGRSQPALIVAENGKKVTKRQAVRGSLQLEISRYFTHFDLFLPDFERKVADECAALFGMLPYSQPPLQ
ncbi:MAG: tRNA lysidine(34) synthetase TilS [Hyphomicrobiales bacterium]|nr:tRNA lysidine(34) synthetase TilS [Hyphomicrobiales bacterium]MCP5000965.1 tRNA lysidine(34) synthetase TilS [Hyphomicrobiales bacterium]